MYDAASRRIDRERWENNQPDFPWWSRLLASTKTSNPPQQYNYRPLEDSVSDIRLLKILPLPSGASGPLRCAILHWAMTYVPKPLYDYPPPAYETVSYCWGDPYPCCSIIVDGRVLHVPVNTEKALRRMALHDGARTIWIDAVCINQKDLEERAQQVTLMGKIYASSYRNLIYLGDEDELTARAVDNIEEISNEMREISKRYPQGSLFGSQGWKYCQGPMRSKIDSEAILAFFSFTWFSRVWPVQEVVLARSSKVYCGSKSLDFSVMIDFAAWLLSFYVYYTPEEVTSSPGLQSAQSLRRFRSLSRAWNRAMSLAESIMMTRDLEASDSRDKIFGMLGLTHPSGDLPRLLRPGYSKDAATVLRDACLHILQVERSASPLKLLHLQHEDEVDAEGFPSWVFRLDRPSNREQDPGILPFPMSKLQVLSNELQLDTEAEHVLPLKGRLIGDVSFLSQLMLPGTRPEKDELLSVLLPYKSKTAVYDEGMLARTLAGNAEYLSVSKPGVFVYKDGYLATSTTRSYLRGYQALLDQLPTGNKILRPHQLARDTDQASKDASQYLDAINIASRHRRLMGTRDGHVGLAPRACKIGDLVVSLSMTPMMVILRRVEDEYLIIGECYVDGAIQASVKRDHEDVLEWPCIDAEEERVFRIC